MQIFAAAIAAVEPGRIVARALDGEIDHRVPAMITGAARVRLLAVGKAALGMAREAHARFGAKISDALVIAPSLATADFPSELHPIVGAHPLPDASSERAGRAALEFVKRAEADELILFLLSGGASALAVVPAAGISLNDKISLTASMMRAGASIRELNAVRKHLSALKGGGLLRALKADTRILSLILSDVPGNDLGTIGSGPATADPTTFADAIAVLKRRRLWGRTTEAVRDRLERGAAGELAETVKPEDPAVACAISIIVGDNQSAQEAAAECAQQLGYRVEHAGSLSDDAERVGHDLATRLRRLQGERVCLIAGGEPVVTVSGDGRGGRAQHCALAMAIAFGEAEQESKIAAMFAGTDGIDGPTDAAGAIVTPATLARAREAGLDAAGALARNDSYTFFRALGDLLVTGPTGTNVADIFVGLVNS
ncbi:MAG: glycerate kinase type-2 family protein [Candidatus Binataceae bacterium]